MGGGSFTEDASLVSEFVSESLEHLDSIDNNLFEYERSPDDRELIDAVFRAIHSIKGTSGFLGIGPINELAHKLETLLDQLRKGKTSVNSEIMDVLFSGCDLLRSMIEKLGQQQDGQVELSDPQVEEQLEGIMDSLTRLIEGKSGKGKKARGRGRKNGQKKQQSGYEISEEMLRDFQVEALEHLEACDTALIALDKERHDKEALNSLFRAIHTIKGTAAYVGQEEISKLSHALESILDLVRQHDDLTMSDEVLDLSFQTIDALRSMLNDLGSEQGKKEAEDLRKRLLAEKEKLAESSQGENSGAGDNSSATDPLAIFKSASAQHIETIKACIERINQKGRFDSAEIDMLFRAAHSLKSSAAYMQFKDIEKECSSLEELLNDIKKGGLPFGPAIVDLMGDTVSSIEKALGALDTDAPQREQGVADPQRRGSEKDSKDKPDSQDKTCQSASRPTTVSGGGAPKTMRIEQRLLDIFMNLVGELIVSRNALGHVERQLTQDNVQLSEVIKGLQKAIQSITRISDEMQRNVMEMRMVPVRNVFQKFPRIIRDISRKTGKKVDLILQGEDTEIDKGIAEDISDPLVHIIRNCVDHGIEMPEVRTKAGKPETGTVILKAYHEGNFIIIDIIDDGAGIDPDKVVKKAVDNGMISPEKASHMSKEEILNLIFMPGFSTAKEVTDISGRGVGMDVVRTNLAKLKGNVRVTSEVGQGTHVRLEVPLTLALVEAMLVGAGEDIYAIPVEAIRETVKITASDINSLMKKKAITHRGKVIGLEFLSHLLNISRNGHKLGEGEQLPVLIIQAANDCLGIAVDKLYRKEEIVIKPLADYLAGLPGIAGASILGDGKTILILEPNELVSMATRN